MTPAPSSLRVAAVLFLVSLAASGVAAGQVPEAPQPPVAAAQDARETRQQLDQILRRLPPSIGGALRLDSSLLRNESYLATACARTSGPATSAEMSPTRPAL